VLELRIEPASDDLYLRLREWRYPPPYDFYDGDVDPQSNPERYFVALDREGELVGFYYFEEKPPDLDYGLGLRPDLVGQGLGLDFFNVGLASRANAMSHGVSICTSPSSTSGRAASTSGPSSRLSHATCGASSASAKCRS
jgi:hypothetical protein